MLKDILKTFYFKKHCDSKIHFSSKLLLIDTILIIRKVFVLLWKHLDKTLSVMVLHIVLLHVTYIYVTCSKEESFTPLTCLDIFPCNSVAENTLEFE